MGKIKVSCPKCGAQYPVDEAYLGKRARCKKCQSTFVLTPTEGGQSPASPVAPAPGALPASSAVAAADQRPGRQSATEDQVPAVWQPGDVLLDLYEVQGVLGEGGMGKVYKVKHRGWNK